MSKIKNGQIFKNILSTESHVFPSLPTQAQVCLASVYSQEQVRNASKAVHYLKMAAESGVSGLLDASILPSPASHLDMAGDETVRVSCAPFGVFFQPSAAAIAL